MELYSTQLNMSFSGVTSVLYVTCQLVVEHMPSAIGECIAPTVLSDWYMLMARYLSKTRITTKQEMVYENTTWKYYTW